MFNKYTPFLVISALLLFSLGMRLPAIFIPHIENDEVIYQTLAEKVSKNIHDYTLQGTPLIEQLPRGLTTSRSSGILLFLSGGLP